MLEIKVKTFDFKQESAAEIDQKINSWAKGAGATIGQINSVAHLGVLNLFVTYTILPRS